MYPFFYRKMLNIFVYFFFKKKKKVKLSSSSSFPYTAPTIILKPNFSSIIVVVSFPFLWLLLSSYAFHFHFHRFCFSCIFLSIDFIVLYMLKNSLNLIELENIRQNNDNWRKKKIEEKIWSKKISIYLKFQCLHLEHQLWHLYSKYMRIFISLCFSIKFSHFHSPHLFKFY